jgi:hypothetical protein
MNMGNTIVVINDETGDFVAADAIVVVMSTETMAGETTAKGSLIYLAGMDDVFVSPLSPAEIFERLSLGAAPAKREAA